MAVDRTSKGARTLYDYWVHGEGAIRVGWGTDGSFGRCTNLLRGKVRDPEGLCAEYHKAATGEWPAEKGVPSAGNIEPFSYMPNAPGVRLGWSGLLAPIGKPTGDGRVFARGSLTHRPLPLPLTWQRNSKAGSHDGAVVIGSTEYIAISENMVFGGGEIFTVDPTVMPRFAEDLAEVCFLLQKGVIGPSVELDDYAFTYKDKTAIVSKGRITNATLLPVPAFAEARAFEIFELDDNLEPLQTLLASGGDLEAFISLRRWLENLHPRDARGRWRDKHVGPLSRPNLRPDKDKPNLRRGRRRRHQERDDLQTNRDVDRRAGNERESSRPSTGGGAARDEEMSETELEAALEQLELQLDGEQDPEKKRELQERLNRLNGIYRKLLRKKIPLKRASSPEPEAASNEEMASDSAEPGRNRDPWARDYTQPEHEAKEFKELLKTWNRKLQETDHFLEQVLDRQRIESYDVLSGGAAGDTRVVTFANGTEAVNKISKEFWGVSARDQADAEEAASLLAAAMDLNAPRVLRADVNNIWMPYIKDATLAWEEFGHDAHSAIRNRPKGILMALLDVVIANGDRHAGNFFIDDGGDPIPIDHGLAWSRRSTRPGGPASTTFRGAAQRFVTFNQDGEMVWVDQMDFISRKDVETVIERLKGLKSQFDNIGQPDWYQESLERLEAIRERATGSEVYLS